MSKSKALWKRVVTFLLVSALVFTGVVMPSEEADAASAKKSVAYKSSKKSVATVSKKGAVTAKGIGSAKITVTVTGKNKKKKSTYVKINVKDKTPVVPVQTPVNVEVTGVTASISPSATLSAGTSAQITASVLPANATNKQLTYTSSDTNVAVVNAAGAVTGINAGTAIIKVTAANGKYKEILVTVVDIPVSSITSD